MESAGQLTNAISSSCDGVRTAISSGREDLVQTCTRILLGVLDKSMAQALESIPSGATNPENAKGILKKHNQDGKYTYTLRKIDEALEKCKKRTK